MKNFIISFCLIFFSLQVYSQDTTDSKEEQLNKFAEEWYEKTVEKEQEHFSTAIEHYNNKEYFLALQEVNKAIESSIFFKKFKHYKLRADAKAKLGDYRGAIIDIDSSISWFPEHKLQLLYSRSYFNLELNNYEKSLKDLNYIIENQHSFIENENNLNELNETIAMCYGMRGIIKISLKKLDEGCLDLSKAGELGFKNAYSLITEYCN